MYANLIKTFALILVFTMSSTFAIPTSNAEDGGHDEDADETWTDRQGHEWDVHFQDCRESGCGDGEGECIPFEEVDCSSSPDCGAYGHCTARQSHGTQRFGDHVCSSWQVCGATSDAQCEGSRACIENGNCHHAEESYFYFNKCGYEDDACYEVSTHRCKVSDESCAASTQCDSHGKCGRYHTPNYARCEATEEEHCQQADVCRETGACGIINISPTICAPTDDAHCAQSADCRRFGHCALKENGSWQHTSCIAETDAHCEESQICDAQGKCTAEEGRCINSASERE